MYTKEEGRYVLDVTKVNDDYSYTLKDKQNGKETKFEVELEINSNVGKLNAFNIQNKINIIQAEAAFDEAIETITSYPWISKSPLFKRARG